MTCCAIRGMRESTSGVGGRSNRGRAECPCDRNAVGFGVISSAPKLHLRSPDAGGLSDRVDEELLVPQAPGGQAST